MYVPRLNLMVQIPLGKVVQGMLGEDGSVNAGGFVFNSLLMCFCR